MCAFNHARLTRPLPGCLVICSDTNAVVKKYDVFEMKCFLVRLCLVRLINRLLSWIL